ncbi:transglutaminase-like domain-containing protein [Neorhodopirellula pilleata]|uniref:Transglutaminase-like superfamily protein n=1 Tax=Neorhodopirellula pilleata TaxID=2714738 RepID=A0A5C5ZGT4_9BACT|nr:transglutaminase family protein [Neorhodopirellula pilleata]TWT86368.1 Transglutaminase-like superfamily protein [Neorhodopirellula pilleata]
MFTVLLSMVAIATAVAQKSETTTYSLPFAAKEIRGFCASNNRLFVFHHPARTLYASGARNTLTPVESLEGWAISDVAIVDGTPVYCSRDRTLRVVNGKVIAHPIAGTTNLISIASVGQQMFLLDAGKSPSILCLDVRTGKQNFRFAYDGINPVDLAVTTGGLFVLDMGDRCIHQLSGKSGETTLKIQVGPGVSGGSGGIVFLERNRLYVHEGDYNRLRPITWKTEPNLVSSWSMPLKMTFIQESDNESETDKSMVEFDVPIPTRGFSQVVSDLEWSQQPDEVVKDKFGQEIAVFRDIAIPPGGHHELRYETSVYTRAVQYDPPKAPLAALDRIPQEIKDVYLSPDPIFSLTSPELIAAAKDARLDENGTEATDVRTLIENIAWYQSRRFTYVMDDTWDDSQSVLERAAGSCSEYSFVFSSLCRLNQIPTRLVGGIQLADYGTKHESSGFHRWTEVYFPELGWIPVDVTKFDDGESESRDCEFLFGTPGYIICLSRGGIDNNALGSNYYIRRNYRGGRRSRRTFVVFEPHESYATTNVPITTP